MFVYRQTDDLAYSDYTIICCCFFDWRSENTKEENRWKYGWHLPGYFVTSSQICRRKFGESFAACGNQTGAEICLKLCCGNGEVTSEYKHPPDGLKCDHQKYCYNGECIVSPNYRILKKID